MAPLSGPRPLWLTRGLMACGRRRRRVLIDCTDHATRATRLPVSLHSPISTHVTSPLISPTGMMRGVTVWLLFICVYMCLYVLKCQVLFSAFSLSFLMSLSYFQVPLFLFFSPKCVNDLQCYKNIYIFLSCFPSLCSFPWSSSSSLPVRKKEAVGHREGAREVQRAPPPPLPRHIPL